MERRAGLRSAAKRRKEQRRAYSDYLASPEWKSIRAQVIFRDGGQCRALIGPRRCGSRKDIEVHHLTYARFGNELLSDLVTLCHDCHKEHHKRTGRR